MLKSVKHLYEAGFAIHNLKTLSKAPKGNKWSIKPVASFENLKRTRADGNNVGVRTGEFSKIGGLYLHIIDVDIRDPAYKDEALAKLREMLPSFDYEKAPAVISGSGGESRHFYMFCDKPYRTKVFAKSDSTQKVRVGGRIVEKRHWELHLLGTGAQAVIPPSIHPDTKKPYTWLREFDFFEYQMGNVHSTPSDEVLTLFDYNSSDVTDEPRQGIQAKDQKPFGFMIEELRADLKELDYDQWIDDHDGWVQMGMSIHFETNGSKEGFDLWCEISKASEKWSEQDSATRWKSFKIVPEDKQVTFANIRNIAAEAREDRIEDDFDDLGDEVEDLGPTLDIYDPFLDILGDPSGSAPKKPDKKKSTLDDDEGDEKYSDGALLSQIEDINSRHAIVRMNASTSVMDLDKDGNMTGLGKPSDFKTFLENVRIKMLRAPTRPIALVWLKHPKRNQYTGIEFKPYGINSEPPEKSTKFNLWTGFSVEPDPNASCVLFLDHLKNIICSGNEAHYDYLIKWFAHMVQFPQIKPGVAVIARGLKGTGKDTPFEYFGKIVSKNYVPLGSTKELFAKFNVYLEKALLVHMQEGFWAGNSQEGSELKSIITSNIQSCEPKGVNRYNVDSYLRLFISSNSEWVVPATSDERRFFIVDVSNEKMQDIDYFTALRKEMNGDGPAALLYHLSQIDLTNFVIFKPLGTRALDEQKVHGLKGVSKFIYNCLQEGSLGRLYTWDDKGLNYWATPSISQTDKRRGKRVNKDDLFNQYEVWNAKLSWRPQALEIAQFSKKLYEILPSTKGKKSGSGSSTVHQYRFAELDECRAEFDMFISGKLDWLNVHDGMDASPEDDLGPDEDVDDLGPDKDEGDL